MPKRVVPKRGWKSQASWINPPKPSVIYSEDVFAKICVTHKIPSAIKERFQRNLEHWGHVYNSFEADADTKPTNAQIAAAIREVKASAGKLLSRMSPFDDETDRVMARAWFDLMQDATHNQNAPMRKVGAWVEFDTEHGKGAHYQDWGDIRIAVRFLNLICDKALDAIPRGQRGRKRHSALDMWAYQVAGFWLEDLGRPLTVDAIKGQGITPASHFLADCMKPLNPKAVCSLPTALKRVRPDLIRVKSAPHKVQLLMQTKPA